LATVENEPYVENKSMNHKWVGSFLGSLFICWCIYFYVMLFRLL
jgi:hypothetical protein